MADGILAKGRYAAPDGRLIMRRAVLGWLGVGLLALTVGRPAPGVAPPAAPRPVPSAEQAALAARAHAILKANCYRCHGQEGAVEGGLNYILDRDKLIARRKVVPG